MSKRIVLLLSVVLVTGACSTSSTEPIATSSASSTVTTIDASTSSSAGATTSATTGLIKASDGIPRMAMALIDDVLAHDDGAFTQGLAHRDGLFYESTGRRGESTVRIVDPSSGEVLASVELPDEYFGEGLEVVGDRIVQLTWTSQIAFIWDTKTLAPLGTYTYEGEGWGLCAWQERFYMSNGSSQLTIRDLETFEPIGTIDVTMDGVPVENLNELECTTDGILANVWKSDVIVVIDPGTGIVVGRILTDLLHDEVQGTEGIDVLNGIAYDVDSGSYYFTGKYWPSVFEVHLEEITPQR